MKHNLIKIDERKSKCSICGLITCHAVPNFNPDKVYPECNGKHLNISVRNTGRSKNKCNCRKGK